MINFDIRNNILYNPRGMISFSNGVIKWSRHSFSDNNIYSYIYDIKKVVISRDHVLYKKNSKNEIYLELINDGKVHEYISDDFIYLSTACANSKYPAISRYVDEQDFIKFKNIAEVGVMFGNSSKYIIKNFNFDKIDLFEKEIFYKDIILKNISSLPNFNKCTIYWGDCRAVSTNNTIYDLIFFDPNHKYKMTFNDLYSIFIHFLPNINENTLVIFDDYDNEDVQKLVETVMQLKKFKARFLFNEKLVNLG